MPSLADAYARIERGNEHLEQLRTLHNSITEAHIKAVVIHTNPDPITVENGQAAEMCFVDLRNLPPIPVECRILAGDIASSFRSALNYLVVELSELDSGVRHDHGTQFPIESLPEQFKGNRPRCLAGVNDIHVAAIERLQPYNGGDWLGHLRDLSNMDKHRNLLMIGHDQMVRVRTTLEPATDAKIGHLQMYVEISPTLRIAFGDGLPLIQTLESITSQVSQTLDAFNPEFQ